MKADTEKILRGEETDGESVNRVEDVPEKFKGWLKDNRQRSEQVYSTPYFVTDNMKYVPEKFMEAYGSKLPYKTYAEYEQAMKYNREHGGFTPEQWKNIRELNKVLPVMQGKIMNFGEADSSNPNPHFTDSDAHILGYKENCQTCTMAFELRKRGFNIEAIASPKGEKNYWHWAGKNGITAENNFLTADGQPAKYKFKGNLKTMELREKYLIEETSEVGRYEVWCAWKPNPDTGKINAHVFILEKQINGHLVWYDPQTSLKNEQIRKSYLGRMNGAYKVGIRRIDDKIINTKVSIRFTVKSS